MAGTLTNRAMAVARQGRGGLYIYVADHFDEITALRGIPGVTWDAIARAVGEAGQKGAFGASAPSGEAIRVCYGKVGRRKGALVGKADRLARAADEPKTRRRMPIVMGAPRPIEGTD